LVQTNKYAAGLAKVAMRDHGLIGRSGLLLAQFSQPGFHDPGLMGSS
jgi:hypothetical protein